MNIKHLHVRIHMIYDLLISDGCGRQKIIIRTLGPNACISDGVLTPPQGTNGTRPLHCRAPPPAFQGSMILRGIL